MSSCYSPIGRNTRTWKLVWIYYNKTYDFVPHSWISKYLQMFNIGDNVFFSCIRPWRPGVRTCVVISTLGVLTSNVVYSLLSLQFIITLTPLSMILSEMKAGHILLEGNEINHLLHMDDLKRTGKTNHILKALPALWEFSLSGSRNVRLYQANVVGEWNPRVKPTSH